MSRALPSTVTPSRKAAVLVQAGARAEEALELAAGVEPLPQGGGVPQGFREREGVQSVDAYTRDGGEFALGPPDVDPGPLGLAAELEVASGQHVGALFGPVVGQAAGQVACGGVLGQACPQAGALFPGETGEHLFDLPVPAAGGVCGGLVGVPDQADRLGVLVGAGQEGDFGDFHRDRALL